MDFTKNVWIKGVLVAESKHKEKGFLYFSGLAEARKSDNLSCVGIYCNYYLGCGGQTGCRFMY